MNNLTPLTLWALSFGCCIGWGSFILPGTTFLPIAGTLGTLIAVLLGAVVMILIAYNYHFLIQKNSNSGGVITFIKDIFSWDHAFFCGGFLWLAYIAVLWMNATAFSLMVRNLIGDTLQIGFHYEFVGYDVYGGEVFFTLFLLGIFGVLFARASSFANVLIKIAAVFMIIGVIFCFISALSTSTEPIKFYFHENKPYWKQILPLVAIIPWTFVGFETISQYTNEFKEIRQKSFPIMISAIICAAIVYILMALLATMKFPDGLRSSSYYLNNLQNLNGIERVPTFFVISETLGLIFLIILVISVLTTSLFGYYRTVSNLIQLFARENLMSHVLSTRKCATIFIFLSSLAIPFFGRNALSWLADISTIGATIAYGYASACAYVLAKRENNRLALITGGAGIICALLFTFFLLIPNLWSISVLTQESYLILAIWGIIGFIYFNLIFKRDEKRFGTSPIVWIIMFFLVFFSSLMWMRERMYEDLTIFIHETNKFYSNDSTIAVPRFAYANMQSLKMRDVLLKNTMILLTFTLIALGHLFIIQLRIKRKEMLALESEKRRAEEQKRLAEEHSRAKSTFLSNMSHDIRTPMNAIIGYTTLAKRDETTFNDLKNFMEKIDVSSKHLLDLINDILEMSRIESGRLELELGEVNLKKVLDDLKTMFQTQMETKGIAFSVDAEKIRHQYVMCDKNRFNRILLNLVGNAYKFTPSGKSVSVTLSELEDGQYNLSVKDTGIGMSEEFAKKIFEAFERERTSTVSGIQGTGLGTAITKSIVELMGGTIDVVTKKGVGTEFIVHVAFEIVENPNIIDAPAQVAENLTEVITSAKILLVDDIEVNREIAMMMLEQFGFEVETAVDGRDAVDKAASNSYDLILMDIQMPIMNGYEAAGEIRKSGNAVPIVAMTANAMPEDIKRAHAAGMNDHIPKPLDMQKMLETINRLVKKERI